MASLGHSPVLMDEILKRLDANTLLLVSVPVIVLSIIVVYILVSKSKSGKYPPVLKGLPLVGSVPGFMGLERADGKWVSTGPIKMIWKGMEKHGSVFTAAVFHKKITFLLTPEVTHHFFKAAEKDLSQKEVYQFNVPTFGPGVVFDVDYPIRMEQFRFFADSLKVNKMRSYVAMMVQEAEAFFGKWGDEGEVELKHVFSQLILLTASRCLLGREVREGIFDKVAELFRKLDEGMVAISVFFPYLPIKVHRERDEARKELHAIMGGIIRARKAAGVKEDDMLQVFIDSKYKATGRDTTEQECAGMLIAALFGGQHTSSLTSAWTGAHLLQDKEWLKTVQEEQVAVMGRHGNKLDYDILNEMDALHLTVKETLRLHPPLMLLLRYVNNDFSVTTKEGQTYTVPKGHIVAASPTVAGRLPTVYSNPDKFEPQRFLPGREEDKAHGSFSFIAFGGGRHGCMGETFAYMQIKTLWTILLRDFDMELVSPFPESDYASSLVVTPKGKITMRYRRRKLVPNV